MEKSNQTQIYLDLLNILENTPRTAILTTISGDQIEKHIYHPSEEDSEITALVDEAYLEGSPKYLEGNDCMTIAEPFCCEERMLIFGGGHVSLALSEFAAKLGFAVYVTDDRPTFANDLRFPWAEKVLCDSFTHAIETLQVKPTDYIIILTRGHKHDRLCLETLYNQPVPAYMGMIGSKRRVRGLKEQLIEEGTDPDWLARLHSPIGLDIHAVTPEEIAISILAEIIAEKRTPSKDGSKLISSDVDMRVIEVLAHVPEKMSSLKKAAITILETKGSTPRKAGAKMIVYENGMIDGTIGGGCSESSLMGVARELIQTGGFKICHVDMTGTVAEDEGMVCGGTMKVLIETY